jgi:hypothetical protein
MALYGSKAGLFVPIQFGPRLLILDKHGVKDQALFKAIINGHHIDVTVKEKEKESNESNEDFIDI